MIRQIKGIEEVVYGLLLHNPELRDDDLKLLLKVWGMQNPKIRTKTYLLHVFAKDFLAGEYAHPASVIRCRAKLQEKYPPTRGKRYNERHNLADETTQGILLWETDPSKFTQ